MSSLPEKTTDKDIVNPIFHLNTLHNNPFIFSSALLAFYESLERKDHSILLSYLVLPLALHKESRKFLCNARSTSNLTTMISNKKFVHGLAERVGDFKDLTNLTIHYLVGAQALSVQGSQILTHTTDNVLDAASPDGLVRAAQRFAIFCNPYEIPMIYRMLGVFAL